MDNSLWQLWQTAGLCHYLKERVNFTNERGDWRGESIWLSETWQSAAKRRWCWHPDVHCQNDPWKNFSEPTNTRTCEEASEDPIQVLDIWLTPSLWTTVCGRARVGLTGVLYKYFSCGQNYYDCHSIFSHIPAVSADVQQSFTESAELQVDAEKRTAGEAQSGEKIKLKMGVKWSAHWSAEEVKALISITRGTLESGSDCDFSDWQ